MRMRAGLSVLRYEHPQLYTHWAAPDTQHTPAPGCFAFTSKPGHVPQPAAPRNAREKKQLFKHLFKTLTTALPGGALMCSPNWRPAAVKTSITSVREMGSLSEITYQQR